MTPSERLVALGLELPPVARPLAAYVPATTSGGQVITSGQLPSVQGELVATGKLGAGVSLEQGVRAARVAVLNALAAAASELGGVDNIARVVKVVVYVASTPEFTAQPQVANGASELLGEVFGDAGRHVRAAVGVASLPLDAPVEVELVVEGAATS
ncbi:RidA family protein [Micropruina sonneratiae]|uniref:RidA family protein n=1 Tax=Micropruina sonneratiae TaxID=2986940 RepID=UPI0022272A13|nr:RidA family protein [Micropruina sp. KQZ13P-5]MCW3156466.1 RidA family protein [Micropruina sp. KQZ13P-5]